VGGITGNVAVALLATNVPVVNANGNPESASQPSVIDL